MAAYGLSGKADADLDRISEYTFVCSGLAQARGNIYPETTSHVRDNARVVDITVVSARRVSTGHRLNRSSEEDTE